MATSVRLADGTTYEIPAGERGTYPWVREASLISKAYEQGRDTANALLWQKEYQRRLGIYTRAQQGDDMRALLAAGSPDLLAPLRILGRAAEKILEAAGDIATGAGTAAKGLGDLTRWIPAIVLGLLVVLGIAASRGNLGLKVSR